MSYKIEFEFLNDLGEWKKDDVSANGTMTYKEAVYWRKDFAKREGFRNVKIVEY